MLNVGLVVSHLDRVEGWIREAVVEVDELCLGHGKYFECEGERVGKRTATGLSIVEFDCASG